MGKDAKEPASSKMMAQISKDLYGQTTPIRNALIQSSANFLGNPQTVEQPAGYIAQPVTPYVPTGIPNITQLSSGGGVTNPYTLKLQPSQYVAPETVQQSIGQNMPWDYSQSPVWQGLNLGTNRAYDTSKDSILSMIPVGGQLENALAQNEFERAAQKTTNASAITADELDRAMKLAFGQLGSITGGLQGSAQQQAAAMQAQADQNQAKGSAVGTIIGGLVGGPPGAAVGGTAGSIMMG